MFKGDHYTWENTFIYYLCEEGAPSLEVLRRGIQACGQLGTNIVLKPFHDQQSFFHEINCVSMPDAAMVSNEYLLKRDPSGRCMEDLSHMKAQFKDSRTTHFIIIMVDDVRCQRVPTKDVDFIIHGGVIELGPMRDLLKLLANTASRPKLPPVKIPEGTRLTAFGICKEDGPHVHRMQALLESLPGVTEHRIFHRLDEPMQAMQQRMPDIVLVSDIAVGSNLQIAQLGVQYDGQLLEFIKRVRAAKQSLLHPVIIGFDMNRIGHYEIGWKYLEAGCDFFINTYLTDNEMLANAVALLAVNKELGQYDWMVYSNIMYSHTTRYNLFDDRSQVTADTKKEVKFLRKTLAKHRCKWVLDAGCGDGRIAVPLANGPEWKMILPEPYSLLFRNFEVVAIDNNPVLIEEAEKSLRWNYLNPRFLCMPLVDARASLRRQLAGKKTDERKPYPDLFDAVIMMWHVICEFRTAAMRAQLLREMHSVLRPGGILIFDFPDKAKHIHTDASGTYQDVVNGFMKYIGFVPEVGMIISELQEHGFSSIEYSRVHWGIDKFVVVAKRT